MTREELIGLCWGMGQGTSIGTFNAMLSIAAMLRADGEEIERLRMQLAACGVIANANTVESAAHCRDIHPDYWCDSVAAVADTVDREMALRARVAELEAAQRMRPISDAPTKSAMLRTAYGLHYVGRFREGTMGEPQWSTAGQRWRADCCGRFVEPIGWWPLPAVEADHVPDA